MSGAEARPAGALIPRRRRLTLGEQVVRAVLFLAGLGLVGAAVWVLRFLVVPVVVAFLFTYVMGALADLLENRGLSRAAAVSVCFAILLGGLAAVLAGTWPSLEAWLSEMPEEGQRSVFEVQLEQRLAGWQASLAKSYPHVDWPGHFEKLHHFLEARRRSLVEGLPTMAMEALSHVGSLVLALIIAFFLLLDGTAMKKAVVALVPNRYFEGALLMLHRVDRQVASYLLGTALENVLVTVILAVPLYLMGMPNAFLFAVIFGVANVIPFAGPFIGAAAGLFFSLLDPSAPSVGALVAVYVVVHLVDAMLINPWVMGKSLDMHPMTVIVGISVGGTLGGVVGMLVIIPLIAVAKAIATTVSEGIANASTD